jgi:hypothetical protein
MTVLLCLACLPAFSTVLGDLAASMQPKTWAELNTQNFSSTLLYMPEGNGGCIFDYCDDLTWNPGTDEAYFLGGSHYGPGRFIAYSAATNTWREVDRPQWVAVDFGHGYDHSALDPARGWFYHNPMSGRLIVHCWETGNKRWRSSLTIPASVCTWEEMACCRGLCFYPDYERGGLVFANGKVKRVFFFGTSTGKFTILGNNVQMAGYHNVAKYNPAQKMVYLGGGNGESTLQKLDSTGNISPIRQGPVAIGINSSVTTVCPVSGDLLVLSSGRFDTYHLATDTWTRQSVSVPLFSHGSSTIFATVAGTVTNHGVTMWCRYAGGQGRTWLYKHAQGSAVESGGTANAGTDGIAVRPNPFNPAVVISINDGHVGATRRVAPTLAIYDPHGRMVHKTVNITANSYTWDASGMPAGIYLLKASVGKKTYTRKLFLQK